MDQNQKLFTSDIPGLILLVRRWWKPLLLVVGAAFILSIVVSAPYFIKPLYKSSAIVYASNIAPYATENTTEQLIQMLESDDILLQLNNDFNLMKHYEIDSTSKLAMTELRSTYSDRVSVSKTEYESAEIVVYDTDRQKASDICDSIMSYVNHKIISLQRAKYVEVVKIYKDQMDKKRMEMDSMENAIKNLRVNYGILEFEGQIRPFAKEYYKALAQGKAGNGNSRLDLIERNFAQKGGDYISLKEHLWRVRGTYNDLKVNYENALRDLEKELTFVNKVTRPFPAEKKSYPVRWLIVLGATLATFFFGIVLILVFEQIKVIRTRLAG